MTDMNPLLTDALKALGKSEQAQKATFGVPEAGRQILAPSISQAVKAQGDLTLNLTNDFTVELDASRQGYDAMVTVLVDENDQPRARAYQQLYFLQPPEGEKESRIEETFSNSSLDSAFSANDKVRALCFLKKNDTDEWLKASVSSTYVFT